MEFFQFHVMQSKCQLVENYLPEKPRETITPLETAGVLQKGGTHNDYSICIIEEW